MGRDDRHIQLINLFEFRRLGIRRSRHTRELLVHAEIILNRNGGQGLVFFADVNALLRFNRLVQSIRPAPSRHQPAGELIDDDHFTVLYDIIDIALKYGMGLEGLLHVMQRVDLAGIVKVMHPEQPLDLGHAAFSQRHRTAFFVNGVITLRFDGGAVFLRWIYLYYLYSLSIYHT